MGSLKGLGEGEVLVTLARVIDVAVSIGWAVGVVEAVADGGGLWSKVTLTSPCGLASSDPSAIAAGKCLLNCDDSTFSQGISTT